jgi:hypothetical protein
MKQKLFRINFCIINLIKITVLKKQEGTASVTKFNGAGSGKLKSNGSERGRNITLTLTSLVMNRNFDADPGYFPAYSDYVFRCGSGSNI